MKYRLRTIYFRQPSNESQTNNRAHASQGSPPKAWRVGYEHLQASLSLSEGAVPGDVAMLCIFTKKGNVILRDGSRKLLSPSPDRIPAKCESLRRLWWLSVAASYRIPASSSTKHKKVYQNFT